MDKIIKSLFILSVLFFASCANIKPVGGGPDDTTPPKVKKSVPENNSTNFKGQTIALEFDEYIDAEKLRENIIISPLYDSTFDIKVKKKTLYIKFDKPFKENTTYNINLSESIKDLTRGNYIKNLSLAFSTGPIIDSLSLKGNTYNFINGKPLANIAIQLYSTSDTNNIVNSKPLYYTESDDKGKFVLKNIKEGKYDVYALQDLNSNFKYDTNEKENIAYIYDVVINKKDLNVELGLTKIDSKPPEIFTRKQEFDYYILSTNEGLEKYTIKSDSKNVISEIQENRKTIKIFNNFNTKDSISLYYQFTDSSGNTLDDTTKIVFTDYKPKKNENLYTLNIEPKTSQLLKNDTITINLSKPFSKINYPLISLKKDSSIIKYEESDLIIDNQLMKIKIVNKYPFKDTLVLNLPKGSFIGMAGDSSLPFKVKFKYKKEENYGILGGIINCQEPLYIFQLIDNKGKILDTKINPAKFYYNYLEPGDYQLKVIIDVNKNGRWDATNFYKDIPPEPIKYYKEKINLRANWELLDIKFDVK